MLLDKLLSVMLSFNPSDAWIIKSQSNIFFTCLFLLLTSENHAIFFCQYIILEGVTYMSTVVDTMHQRLKSKSMEQNVWF